METYKEDIRRQKDLEIDSEPDLITNQEEIDDLQGEGEPEEMLIDVDSDGVPLVFPPESAVDTDSDGLLLGLSEVEGEGSDNDKDYNDEGNASEKESESASDDSEMIKDLKKKKKVRIALFRVILLG